MSGPVLTVPGPPFAEGTTPVYSARIADDDGNPIAAAALSSLTLTIADTLTGAVVNGCQQVDVLNTGRGQVDDDGNLTVTLLTGDTSMSEVAADRVQRSLVFDFAYDGGSQVGRRQADFVLVRLAEYPGPPGPPPTVPYVRTVTSDYDIQASDNGTWFDTYGATGQVTLTLPPWQPGLAYGFTVAEPYPLVVQPINAAAISLGTGTGATDESVSSDQPASFVSLISTNILNLWVAQSLTGTWSFD